MTATELPIVSAETFTFDRLKARAVGLLEGSEIYFPIRHHSPSCATHIAKLIADVKPFAVLVEGPPSFNEFIPFLVHPDAEMPLAVYSYARYPNQGDSGQDHNLQSDNEQTEIRSGSYYPLCDYSPELVALRAGHAVGAQLGFLDLEYSSMALRSPASDSARLMDERAFSFSAALTDLAERLGCRDHNDLWDQLVEANPTDTTTLVANVSAYGALARLTSDETEMEDRLNGHREMAMARIVRTTIERRSEASSDAPIVVVTGAFHTAVLPELVAKPQELPALVEPDGLEVGAGLIRYSYDRLDELNGYSAGMPSPQWYSYLWDEENSKSEPADPAAYRTLSAVAAELRKLGKDGQPSVPSLADAMANTAMLRQLRGRHHDGRFDVVDAAVSCFTKGEDSIANSVRSAVLTQMRGNKVGRLPPGTPRPPLAADFDQVADSLGLVPDTTEVKRVELDVYRSQKDRDTSHFLYGVTSLGVDYGRPVQELRYGAGQGRDFVREVWNVQFSASTDSTLTEASIWGSSLAEAVAAKVQHELEELIASQAGSAELMRLVLAAAQRGVPGSIDRILAALRAGISTDSSLESVAKALREADALWRSREPLEGDRLTSLPAIGEQLFVRGCRLVGQLSSLRSEAADDSVESVIDLHSLLATADWLVLDESLFWQTAETVHRAAQPGRLKGALRGLLWRAGRCSDSDLVTAVQGHLGAGLDVGVGAQYLAGVIQTAREALWQLEELLAAVSSVVAELGADGFLAKLPAWRSAFSALTPREIDRVAELLGDSLGIRASVKVTDMSEERLLQHLHLSETVRSQLTGDDLGSWLGDTGD